MVTLEGLEARISPDSLSVTEEMLPALPTGTPSTLPRSESPLVIPWTAACQWFVSLSS
jgi:hypothetical protein